MYNYSSFKDFSNLPAPLTKDEFVEYYYQMKNGDMCAREKLIIHNVKLVVKEVNRRFSNTKHDSEELVAVGLIALIKAVDKYDITKHIEFSSFATRVIDNDILMFMRHGRKYINDESIYIPITIDKADKGLVLEDTLVNEKVNIELDYENKETILELISFLDMLPERNREILMLYFGFYDDKRYNQTEIGEMFDISRSMVSQLIQKSIKSLQRMYCRKNLSKIKKK